MPATTSRDYLKIRNDLDPELAGSFAHWRREMLRACVNFSLANAATSRRSIEAALTELRRTLTQLGRPEHSVVMTLDHLLDAFGAMCSWVEMSVAGLGDAAAQLVAAKARAQLAKEQLAEVVHPAFHSSVNGVIEAVLTCKELNDARNVAALLSRVTVPPPVVPWRDAYDFPTAVTTPLAETSGPAIVRVMLELNGQPWSTHL